MFQKNFVQKIKTHFVFSKFFFFFFENLAFYEKDNVVKYCRAVQATYDNMAHAHCRPDS